MLENLRVAQNLMTWSFRGPVPKHITSCCQRTWGNRKKHEKNAEMQGSITRCDNHNAVVGRLVILLVIDNRPSTSIERLLSYLIRFIILACYWVYDIRVMIMIQP